MISRRLTHLVRYTKQFCIRNPDIIFTKADKGNITVALNKNIYISKVKEMLEDPDTYTKVIKNPIKSLTKKVHDLLSYWKKKDYISSNTYKRISVSEGNLSRAYALPKIHKPNCPFRIIISSIDSPLYPLASYLHDLISEKSPKPFSKIENSFQLAQKLRGKQLEGNYTLISLDVVSLFTNIPLDLATKSVVNRWKYIRKSTSIPKKEFLSALELVLNSTFFTFNGEIYKQKFGTPMGSPLSPIIADLVMQDLETTALERLGCQLPFYFRYVDDILMAVPRDMIDMILTTFNSFHPRLQFTLEIGGNCINFLDVTIINNNRKLELDWYHKPTFSGRYLNYFSSHPLSQKRGVIMGMLDRTMLLSDPKFHFKNIKLIIVTLLNNDYPVEFVFNTINDRLKFWYNKKLFNTTVSNDDTKRDEGPWFLLPYIDSWSGKLSSVCKSTDMKIAFFSENKLGRFIKGHKDALPKCDNKNVVYKINCKDCDATYVGQTGRKLSSRISEHRRHINWNTNTHSVITEHRMEFSHDFDWENVQILDKEKFLNKRLISEMAFIHMQKNGLNLRSDTEKLHHTYASMLENFS